jgi:hypothetical protein
LKTLEDEFRRKFKKVKRRKRDVKVMGWLWARLRSQKKRTKSGRKKKKLNKLTLRKILKSDGKL